MKYIAAITLAIGLSSLFGCTTIPKLTATQEAYLEAAMATPLTFTLPKSQVDEAWDRAQTFIERFSSMKLQILTAHVIRTYNPTGAFTTFGYYLRKIPMGDTTQFTVQCICNSMSPTDQSLENAHILAYYMKTGNLDSTLVSR